MMERRGREGDEVREHLGCCASDGLGDGLVGEKILAKLLLQQPVKK